MCSPLGPSASAPVLAAAGSLWIAGDNGLALPPDAAAARRADFSGGSWRSRGNSETLLATADPKVGSVVPSRSAGLLQGIEDKDVLQAVLGGKRAPGPGDYGWEDDVHLRKRPVYSMTSPDRACLDLMLPTWTAASSSLQPRAPDPAEYSNLDYNSAVGRNGKLGAPKWSWERTTPGDCREPLRPQPLAVATRHFAMVGGDHHPSKPMPPNWSLRSPERLNLPRDTPTWVPRISSDVRPGPGQYQVRPDFKPKTRARCSFAGRPQNLHPMSSDWCPRTRGSYQPTCEDLRMKLKPLPGAVRKRFKLRPLH